MKKIAYSSVTYKYINVLYRELDERLLEFDKNRSIMGI